uniref:Transcription regulator n=1 Tax=Loigolactobacillus rennini TaxID=238013 RepID=A0A1K2I9N6_9LACO|nr:Transcription regulator [Loigolactobacillus rennini]
MIDEHLLKQLVTFADKHTLSATAEHLMLTQPTVTRGMQKLETDLGVKLFKRQSNQITLNQTGQFAVNEARKVLKQNETFMTRVKNYDRSHRIIEVGSNAPGPIIVLNRVAQHTPNIAVQSELIATADLKNKLEDNQYSFIISNQEIQTEQIESYYLNHEQLSVNLDQFMPQANQATIKFKALKGLSFVVFQDIGPWKQIIQDNIPDAKFLYQAQWEALTEITNYASFPYFNTNITAAKNHTGNQVQIPISDPIATMDFYINYLKTRKKLALSLVESIRNNWSSQWAK